MEFRMDSPEERAPDVQIEHPGQWFVYVIRSLQTGHFYVGSSVDPLRRLRQHNGEIRGGAKYTTKRGPWVLVKIEGPYPNRSSAFRSEMLLKKARGTGRCHVTPMTLWRIRSLPNPQKTN